jgi:hypothetical protein
MSAYLDITIEARVVYDVDEYLKVFPIKKPNIPNPPCRV